MRWNSDRLDGRGGRDLWVMAVVEARELPRQRPGFCDTPRPPEYDGFNHGSAHGNAISAYILGTLGRQAEPPMTCHDIVCVHTMVGSLPGTDAYFKNEG